MKNLKIDSCSNWNLGGELQRKSTLWRSRIWGTVAVDYLTVNQSSAKVFEKIARCVIVVHLGGSCSDRK